MIHINHANCILKINLRSSLALSGSICRKGTTFFSQLYLFVRSQHNSIHFQKTKERIFCHHTFLACNKQNREVNTLQFLTERNMECEKWMDQSNPHAYPTNSKTPILTVIKLLQQLFDFLLYFIGNTNLVNLPFNFL